MGKVFYNFIIFFAAVILLSSCGNVTPQKYFNIAVLNTNIIPGFAGPGFSIQLISPSVKLSDNGSDTNPMKRSEVISSVTEMAEENYENVKSLKVTDDTKDMIDASLKLYEYVIPVLKTEYVKLAELYDNNAPEDQIHQLTISIQENHLQGFTDRYSKVINTGKLYAEKNSIKVYWGAFE